MAHIGRRSGGYSVVDSLLRTIRIFGSDRSCPAATLFNTTFGCAPHETAVPSLREAKRVRAWLERHSRYRMQFTPVHCSWMNQVEQWFSILQRKRLTAPNFADVADLQRCVLAFISEWNRHAHPFDWNAKSFDKVLAKVDAAIKAAA